MVTCPSPRRRAATSHLARPGSVHLNFAPPSGKVLSLAGQGDGPVVDPANAVAFEENAKLAKFQRRAHSSAGRAAGF